MKKITSMLVERDGVYVFKRQAQSDLIVNPDVAKAIIKLEKMIEMQLFLFDSMDKVSEMIMDEYKKENARLKEALRQYGDFYMWEKEINKLTKVD